MQESTYKTHQKILGAIFIAYSALTLLGAISIMVAMNVVQIFVEEEQVLQIVSTFGKLIGTFLIFVSVPSIIAGIGLLRSADWSKTLSLIMGILMLLFFPIGTIIGIYSIWLSAQTPVKEKGPVYATDIIKNA